MSKILTSFIIRTYNEEKWLGEVLKSLFEQTRKDFEVIIVDSGSTDRTLEIIQSFRVVKLIQNPKEDFNYSYTLNLGIQIAQGKYIGILSGHSVPTKKTWYEESIKLFDDPKVAGISGPYFSLPDGSLTEQLGGILYKIKKALGKIKPYYGVNLSNTNTFIRKDLWEEYPFDERLVDGCEDYDWGLEMNARGYKTLIHPIVEVMHSHGGIGKTVYWKRLKGWKKTLGEIAEMKPTRPSNSYSRLFGNKD